MSEQDPLQKRIQEALKTNVEPASDDGLYRDGQLYRFPHQMGTSLEVFPHHGLVRVTTPDRSALELHDQRQPRIGEDSLVFEVTRQRLTVHADGRVLWQWAPEATAAPPAEPEGAGSTSSDLPRHPSGPQKASEAVVSEQEEAGKPDEKTHTPPTTTTETPDERVQLTGRLGRTPTFRTTPKGTFIGKFPLAVHLEDGQTKWHTILAFGPKAQRLEQKVTAGDLVKGREVDVIGYSHTRDKQSKKGKTRVVKEVYAAVVKSR